MSGYAEVATLLERLREAETTVIVLLHAYETDNRPPDAFVSKAMRIRSRLDASPQAASLGPACDCSIDGYNDGSCSMHPIMRRAAATPVQGAPPPEDRRWSCLICRAAPGEPHHPDCVVPLPVQAEPADGPTCPTWCGTVVTFASRPSWPQNSVDYCSRACRDTGRPLRPAPAPAVPQRRRADDDAG